MIMTQSLTTPNYHLSQQNSPVRLAFGAALLGGAGAVAAGLFTTVTPLGGAVFGVSYLLSSRLVYWICEQVNCWPESIVFRIAELALSVIGGIGAAVLITTNVGFPITLATGIALMLTSIGVTAAALLTLGGGLCSSALATGIAINGDSGGASII
jgi:hypothetical protein